MQRVRQEIRNVRWLYNQIVKRQSNMVKSLDEALYKVHHEPYAFIQEEPKNLHLASRDCSLKVLRDQNYYLQSEYAIAMRKDSPYLKQFDWAIKQMQYDGELERLKKKYLSSECNNGTIPLVNQPLSVLLIHILLIAVSCLFLFWSKNLILLCTQTIVCCK